MIKTELCIGLAAWHLTDHKLNHACWTAHNIFYVGMNRFTAMTVTASFSVLKSSKYTPLLLSLLHNRRSRLMYYCWGRITGCVAAPCSLSMDLFNLFPQTGVKWNLSLNYLCLWERIWCYIYVHWLMILWCWKFTVCVVLPKLWWLWFCITAVLYCVYPIDGWVRCSRQSK